MASFQVKIAILRQNYAKLGKSQGSWPEFSPFGSRSHQAPLNTEGATWYLPPHPKKYCASASWPVHQPHHPNQAGDLFCWFRTGVLPLPRPGSTSTSSADTQHQLQQYPKQGPQWAMEGPDSCLPRHTTVHWHTARPAKPIGRCEGWRRGLPAFSVRFASPQGTQNLALPLPEVTAHGLKPRGLCSCAYSRTQGQREAGTPQTAHAPSCPRQHPCMHRMTHAPLRAHNQFHGDAITSANTHRP